MNTDMERLQHGRNYAPNDGRSHSSRKCISSCFNLCPSVFICGYLLFLAPTFRLGEGLRLLLPLCAAYPNFWAQPKMHTSKTIAAIAGVCLLCGCVSPYEAGRRDAQHDISHGVLALEAFGTPRDSFGTYERLLKDKYG